MKLIDDVYAEDGKYTTDGCGPIRESYAKAIRNKLDLPSRTSGTTIRIFPIDSTQHISFQQFFTYEGAV